MWLWGRMGWVSAGLFGVLLVFVLLAGTAVVSGNTVRLGFETHCTSRSDVWTGSERRADEKVCAFRPFVEFEDGNRWEPSYK